MKFQDDQSNVKATSKGMSGLVAGLALCLAAVTPSIQAQTNFPEKTVKLIVPFTPGGSNDVIARIVGEKLSQYWGQPVIVENKPGAGGNVGAGFVANSAADGYTLLVAANNVLTINPSLYARVNFNPVKDFAPVSLLGSVPMLLVVNPSLKVNNVKELIATAKTTPNGGLSYASAGIGTPHHLAAAMFASMANVPMVHVPYKGAGPAVTDVLSGLVPVMFGASNTLLPHIKTGGFRALAVTGDQRLPMLPDVPTVSESGLPGYYADIWVGLVAPSGVPQPIITKINADVTRALKDPAARASLAQQGLIPAFNSPSEFAELIKKDLARWSKVVKDSGAKAD
jgi:tripartite-type tricarboxylate transporter receptor subunit TctC